MDNGDIEGGGSEEEFHTKQSGREYRPVVAHDPAVLEMSSIPPGSSSQAKTNANSDRLNDNENGSEREHRLELFGFDSLVNILGLKSMTGEQVAAPSSPRRDGEDASFTFDRDRPRPNDLKLGTMMGVFVPCLQNILGIIYYIRFSW